MDTTPQSFVHSFVPLSLTFDLLMQRVQETGKATQYINHGVSER